MPSTLEDYEVVGNIGSGSYGTCKKIRRKKDGRTLVWKELDYGTMTEIEKQMLVSEVNLLRELKHQHIVRYYDRIIDRSNTTLYIIMEYCEGGDLSSLISRLKREGRHCEEEFVWCMCRQMVLALKECHSRHKNGKVVLHRDLKPANVFLDSNNNVKLGDFGLARVLNHETSFARTFVGTPYYMSPEQMKYSSYNEKSDIWSMGCLLYELCTLRPPFTASNQKELASRICTGRFQRIPAIYSDELNEIISYMLVVEEHRRPTIEALMAHPSIVKRAKKAEQAGSSSHSGSSDDAASGETRREALRRREEALATKEKLLLQKEKDLETREKNLATKEKLAEERLIRAERLAKEYQAKKKAVELSNNLDTAHSGEAPSILCKGKDRDETSPKKHVTFSLLDQENDWYAMELPGSGGSAAKEHRVDLDQAQRILELRQRLKKAKQRSEEIHGLDMPRYRPQNLIHMR